MTAVWAVLHDDRPLRLEVAHGFAPGDVVEVVGRRRVWTATVLADGSLELDGGSYDAITGVLTIRRAQP